MNFFLLFFGEQRQPDGKHTQTVVQHHITRAASITCVLSGNHSEASPDLSMNNDGLFFNRQASG